MPNIRTQLSARVEVEGFPLDRESKIIGALVARLGGKVTLTPFELENVKGIVLDGNAAVGGINIFAESKPLI